MNKIINQEEMLEKLNGFVKSHQTQKEASEALGVSQQYLSDILKGRRLISDKISRRLGFSKHISYHAIEGIYN